jgi:Tfp pilus assembly protein PilP
MVVAPDGKTSMLTPGTLVGKYGGRITAMTENTVQVKETRSFLVKGEESRKEHSITLSLNPLQETPRPGSRFVVLDRYF